MQISVLVTILSTLAIVQAGAGGASTATSQIKDSGKGGTAYGGTTGPGGRSGNTGSNAGSADGGR